MMIGLQGKMCAEWRNVWWYVIIYWYWICIHDRSGQLVKCVLRLVFVSGLMPCCSSYHPRCIAEKKSHSYGPPCLFYAHTHMHSSGEWKADVCLGCDSMKIKILLITSIIMDDRRVFVGDMHYSWQRREQVGVTSTTGMGLRCILGLLRSLSQSVPFICQCSPLLRAPWGHDVFKTVMP